MGKYSLTDRQSEVIFHFLEAVTLKRMQEDYEARSSDPRGAPRATAASGRVPPRPTSGRRGREQPGRRRLS